MSKALLTLTPDIANTLGGTGKRPKICLQPISAPPPAVPLALAPQPVQLGVSYPQSPEDCLHGSSKLDPKYLSF